MSIRPSLQDRLQGVVPYVAVLLLITAFLISGAEQLGLPFGADAERYLPISMHLALIAFLMFEALLWEERVEASNVPKWRQWHYLLVRYPLYGVGFINLFVMGNYLFNVNTGNPWTLLLIVPTVFCFVQHSEVDPDKTNEEALEEEGETQFEATAEAEDGERPNPLRTLRQSAWNTLQAGISVALIIFVLGIGAYWWAIINGTLVAGSSYDMIKVIGGLSGLFERLLPYLIAYPAVLGLIVLIPGIWTAVSQANTLRTNPQADRNLSESDLEFAAELTGQLNVYKRTASYSATFPWLYYLLLGGFFAGLVFFVILAIYYDEWIVEPLRMNRTEGLGWAYYQQDIAAAGIALLFVNIFGWYALLQLVGRICPIFAEYVIAKKGQTSGHDFGMGEGIYGYLIRNDIRRGKLTPATGFEPKEFLVRIYRVLEKPAYVVTIVLLMITGYLWYYDQGDYDLFTDDFIEYVEYWDRKPIQISYSDVIRVELRCREGGDDIVIGYDIFQIEEHSKDIFDQKAIRRHLTDLERIDANLRAAGVKFVLPERGGVGGNGKLAFDQSCRRALQDEFKPDIARRVWAILKRARDGT